MSPLIARVGRLWSRIRARLTGYRRAKHLTVSELLSLLESEVEAGITSGAGTDEGSSARVAKVELEVPLGIVVNPHAEEGVEVDLGWGVTTRSNLDVTPGGDDGSLTISFKPMGRASPHAIDATERVEPTSTNPETPLSTVESELGKVTGRLEDAGVHTVEAVARASTEAIAEAADVGEADARKLVGFTSAITFGASHETARVLGVLELLPEDLASMDPVALLDEIERAAASEEAALDSDYEADVRELATVLANAERAVVSES